MSYFINKNSKTAYTVPSGYEISETIPVGNWIIKFDRDKSTYYLEKLKDFSLPTKIYGDVDFKAERIIKTFSGEDKNLGVLLRGLKGTGKTLLAKTLCIKSELPVLILSSSFSGPEFTSFLASIKQDVVIFCDEFEKVYFRDYDNDRSKQEDLLAFLEGSISGGKKLFVLTANDGEIHDALLNRLGRVRYLLEYEGLEEEVINSIIEDQLKNKDHAPEIKRLLGIIGDINMDLLVSFIKEVNLYSEESSVVDIANTLNMRPEGEAYICEWVSKEGMSMGGSKEIVYRATIFHNPLTRRTVHLSPEVKNSSKSMDPVSLNVSECDVKLQDNLIILTHRATEYKLSQQKVFKFKFV